MGSSGSTQGEVDEGLSLLFVTQALGWHLLEVPSLAMHTVYIAQQQQKTTTTNNNIIMTLNYNHTACSKRVTLYI